MYVKNFLTPGQFVELIPIGMPIVMKYDVRGVLKGVYSASIDMNPDSEESISIYKNLLESSICKNKILNKNTDTSIYGVIIAKDKFLFDRTGMSQELISKYIIEEIIQHPETINDKFTIYCGYVQSTSALFNGAAGMRHWLSMQGLNVMPGMIVPTDRSDSVMDTLYRPVNKFGDNQIMKYIVFKDNSAEVKNLELQNIYVIDVRRKLDNFGHIVGIIQYREDEYTISQIEVPYNEIYKFNITPKCTIIYNRVLNQIIYSNPVNKVPDTLICPICGNTYSVNSHTVCCSDEHCMSTKWTDINHLLDTFNLPQITGEAYLELIQNHMFQDVCNIFDLEQYADTHLEVTLFTLMRALIPNYTGIKDKQISGFIQRCSNSIPSINYALSNFDAFKSRNNDWATECPILCRWLEDSYNVLELKTFFDIPNIKIIQTDKLFSGTPMFTDRTIVVTGDFIHGSYQDISAIIKSYNGIISNVYHPDATYVVVGGEHSNIDGRIIQLARKNNIPVIEELDFFNKFGIDEDIANNLV